MWGAILEDVRRADPDADLCFIRGRCQFQPGLRAQLAIRARLAVRSPSLDWTDFGPSNCQDMQKAEYNSPA